MSTLFKHKAAKICCSGSEQGMNTTELPRHQNNVSGPDTKTTSMEPGKVFKKTDTIAWTEIWAEWFQLLHDLKRPKNVPFTKNSVMALLPTGSTVTDCKGQSSLRWCHATPTPDGLEHGSHCWWGTAINSSTGNCQQHDVPSVAAGQWHQLNMTTERKAGCFLLNHRDQLQPHACS